MAEAALIGTATAAAKAVAQLVAARALDEINLSWGFKDELQKLNQKFEYIQAFLEDASNSKYAQKSKLVNLWVQKVKDVAYLADDVMDEYAIEIFRRKMEVKNPMDEFCNFFTPSNHVLFHIGMAHKVKEIRSLFDEIDKEAKDIGINQVDIAAKSVTHAYNDDHSSQTRRYAGANASEFIGREDDLEKLLEFICSPSNYEGPDLSTVAIVGMGGVGKTALTRHLYDHERICANFGNKKIWICVSQNFDIIRVLNEMVESVTSSKSKLSNMDAIIRKLKEELNGNKLLLVFDDVWNDEQDSWHCLKEWLHRIGSVPGSVIVINTRSNEVAKAAKAVFKLKLEGLSTDKGWCLLQKIFSSNSSQPFNSSMEEVGRRIVEKCKGVPLAIKVFGDLLLLKNHFHEWESIVKSELWDLPHGQNQILPSLLLSFNNLPSPSLKQCFAYFAIIPKGNCMFKSELIGIWLSQGYLRDVKRKHMTPEEIGEENLKILLSNSLLECVSTKFGIVGYRLHELVYDLAVYVCGADLMKDAKDLSKTGSCRHLVINSVENKATSDIHLQNALTKLRTLCLKGTAIPWDVLIHTRYLRTLKLDWTGITELPPAIALLKHLRFLDVSHNPISTLPDSIGELYQLQTLIIQSCANMVKLPKVVNKLVNLRHISTMTPMFAWKGLQQLTNLQSLPCLSLDDDGDGWTIDELGDLHELRYEIHILGLECVKDKEKSRKAGLSGKANVTKLNLSWVEGRRDISEDNCDEDVLEGLQPHPNITSLEVQNFNGMRFPTWITGMTVLSEGGSGNRTRLKNLTMVKLLNCSRCHTLPKLGQLPLLKCLILSGLYVEYVGIEFYGGDDLDMPEVVSFKCLRELEISGFRRLTTWREPPKAAFPFLETLRIRDCNLLESVPALEIKSLTSLELKNLNSVESLDIIKYSLGLTSLIVNTLPKIESLPQELANCRNLQILDISNSPKLASMPSGLESLSNLKSMMVNLTHISTIAPMFACKESRQSLPSLSLDDDEHGCTSNKLGDLHALREEIPILGLECVKDDEQARKSLECVKDTELARKSLECVKDKELAQKSLEYVQDQELAGKSLEFVEDNEQAGTSLDCVKDNEHAGKSFECIKGKELARKSLECVQEKEQVGQSLDCVKDKEIVGKTLECVQDQELAGKSLEFVKDNGQVGKNLECVTDNEQAGKSLECVQDKEQAGQCQCPDCVKDKEIAGKTLECVQDLELAGKSLEFANDNEQAGKSLEFVKDNEEAGISLECVKDKELAGKRFECVQDKEQAGQSIDLVKDKEMAVKTLKCVQDQELAGKSLECIKDKELAGKSLECVQDKEQVGKSLDCVQDKELTGKSLECGIDKELLGKSLECVKDQEQAGKILECDEDNQQADCVEDNQQADCVKDNEQGGKSLECVKDRELAEKSLECVKDNEQAGKSLSYGCVKDKEQAGKSQSFEFIKDKEQAGKSLKCVKDKEQARKNWVTWEANVTKLNLSWAEGRGLPQLTNFGELHKLGDEIHILGLECVKDKEKARKIGLAGEASVTKIKLSWAEGRRDTSGGIWDEDVLEGLEPHPNITSMEVQNFVGVRFPTWFTEMTVLTEGPSGNQTRLNNLTVVKLLNCSRCLTLPKLGQLPLLKCLILSGFYVESIGIEFYGGNDLRTPAAVSFKCLRELEISGFRRLTTWREPPKAAFSCLETLRIKDCSLLESVPALESKSLMTLQLKNLDSVKSVDIIKYSPSLISLNLNTLPKIASLPQELADCRKLQILDIRSCSWLASFPRELESLVNLQSISVCYCFKVNFVMNDLLQVRSSLRVFEFLWCNIVEIPSSLEECTSLETLSIDRLGSPINISKLRRLWKLDIGSSSTEILRSVLGSAKYLPLLSSLIISGLHEEKKMRDCISEITPYPRFSSLTELTLAGGLNIKTLPQQLGLLTKLATLNIYSFYGLEEMPTWICNLPSLGYLCLRYCEILKCLRSIEDSRSLVHLSILRCPRLAERYAKDGGSDWHNISHIRKVIIDDNTIQDLGK